MALFYRFTVIKATQKKTCVGAYIEINNMTCTVKYIILSLNNMLTKANDLYNMAVALILMLTGDTDSSHFNLFS